MTKAATTASRAHLSCWKLSRINLSIGRTLSEKWATAALDGQPIRAIAAIRKKRDSLPIPCCRGKLHVIKDRTRPHGYETSRTNRYRLVSDFDRSPQADRTHHFARGPRSRRLLVLHKPKAEPAKLG